MKASIKINGRAIGPGEPTYIIAELSANHNGSLERAIKLVHAAKEAGADAVKLQTYTADTITIDHDGKEFTLNGGLWNGSKLYDLYREAYTPWEWLPILKAEANRLDIDLFSSPFDHTAVDFLNEMGVPAYKVASFEIVDIPLLKKIASTGKPVIISTGMANLFEIDEAVRTFRTNGCSDLALLKCTSAYPASPKEVNLRTISHMSQAFGVPTGLSDHTLGIEVPVAAVALGANIIEKHFTLSRAEAGPDNVFSLEPSEFKTMVRAVRTVFDAIGEVSYDLTEEQNLCKTLRRSLFVIKDIKKGQTFSEENIKSIRPAGGLHTRYYEIVIRTRAATDIKRGTPLNWKHILID